MGELANCSGKSVGRVLHCMEVYLQNVARLDVHEMQVGDNVVLCYGKPLAHYEEWLNEETEKPTPVFQFNPNFNEHTHPVCDALIESQFCRQPFVDDRFLADQMRYAIQELRKAITLQDALQIMFIRDSLNGDWNQIHGINLENKVKDSLHKSYWGNDNSFNSFANKAKTHWQHFAMCAVYGLQKQNEN